MARELITREALERIVQRAAELQAHEKDVGDGLTRGEVLALGDGVVPAGPVRSPGALPMGEVAVDGHDRGQRGGGVEDAREIRHATSTVRHALRLPLGAWT